MLKKYLQVVQGFFQVGKGKKWNLPWGEKQELPGILPEKHAILHVKKLKPSFCQKFPGGGILISRGGVLPLPPALRKKSPLS